MKAKPKSKNGGVLLELGPQERQIPAPSRAPAAGFQLRKILVPVDFSDCSKKALQYAIPFAKQFGAELHLLYIEESYSAVAELGVVAVQNVVDAREKLEAFRLSIGDTVPSSASVRTALPYLAIAEAAGELGIDLIILSTHGRTGLKRMFLGSTAEKVVRHAPCPVLIVREREREFIPPTTIPIGQS